VPGALEDSLQDKLTQMRKEKSVDKERADLMKSLLKVTRQRADIAKQYAVRVLLHSVFTLH
jgi:hypothetical protein